MAATEINDEYALGRGLSEAERLDIQHTFLVQAVGDYHIHPHLTKNLIPTFHIAEIATGSGAWILGAAKGLPSSCQLDGYDISSASFPSPDDLPSNVHFRALDAKKPFPAELHNRYDVVHVRYITVAMDEDDWETMTRNILEILKPGGAIQWMEPNFQQVGTILRQTTGATAAGAQKMWNRFVANFSGRVPFGYSTLKGIFIKLGMTDVYEEVMSTDRDSTKREEFSSLISLRACYNGMINMAKNKAPGADWTEQEVEEMFAEALADIESGAYFRWDLHTFIGFKAL